MGQCSLRLEGSYWEGSGRGMFFWQCCVQKELWWCGLPSFFCFGIENKASLRDLSPKCFWQFCASAERNCLAYLPLAQFSHRLFWIVFLYCFLSVQHPLYPGLPNHYTLRSLLKTPFSCAVHSGRDSQSPDLLPPWLKSCACILKRRALGDVSCARTRGAAANLILHFPNPQALPLTQKEVFVSFHLEKELYHALEPTEGNIYKMQYREEMLLKDDSEQPSPYCIWSHISQWKAAFHAGPKTFSGSIN